MDGRIAMTSTEKTINKIAYIALFYAIVGKEEKAESLKRVVKLLTRDKGDQS